MDDRETAESVIRQAATYLVDLAWRINREALALEADPVTLRGLEEHYGEAWVRGYLVAGGMELLKVMVGASQGCREALDRAIRADLAEAEAGDGLR